VGSTAVHNLFRPKQLPVTSPSNAIREPFQKIAGAERRTCFLLQPKGSVSGGLFFARTRAGRTSRERPRKDPIGDAKRNPCHRALHAQTETHRMGAVPGAAAPWGPPAPLRRPAGTRRGCTRGGCARPLRRRWSPTPSGPRGPARRRRAARSPAAGAGDPGVGPGRSPPRPRAPAPGRSPTPTTGWGLMTWQTNAGPRAAPDRPCQRAPHHGLSLAVGHTRPASSGGRRGRPRRTRHIRHTHDPVARMNTPRSGEDHHTDTGTDSRTFLPDRTPVPPHVTQRALLYDVCIFRTNACPITTTGGVFFV
jgi:hypothetical protein